MAGEVIARVSIALALYEWAATTVLKGLVPTITDLSHHRLWRYPIVAYPFWLIVHFAREALR